MSVTAFATTLVSVVLQEGGVARTALAAILVSFCSQRRGRDGCCPCCSLFGFLSVLEEEDVEQLQPVLQLVPFFFFFFLKRKMMMPLLLFACLFDFISFISRSSSYFSKFLFVGL